MMIHAPHLWQHNNVITAGTYPPIHIDFGRNEAGMTLQYRDVGRGQIVWRDYTVVGQPVNAPGLLFFTKFNVIDPDFDP